MKKYLILAALGAMLLGLNACGVSDYDPSITATPGDMFSEACASCHGDEGEGKLGFLLKIQDTKASLADINNKIELGGYVMPAFPGIDAPQRLMLSTYVKTL